MIWKEVILFVWRVEQDIYEISYGPIILLDFKILKMSSGSHLKKIKIKIPLAPVRIYLRGTTRYGAF